MSESFHVQLAKENMAFSAAHFITFQRNICERLHGHNYRVSVDVFGPLDENQYVIDFIALRDSLQEILSELDHHMLLPTQHPQIRVEPSDREVLVTFEDRRWIFPRGDCILLPIPNTTAELLAKHIGQRLYQLLHSQRANIDRIRLAVDENQGQWGVWDWTH